MTAILNILFLSGGIFLTATLLRAALSRIAGNRKKEAATIISLVAFPAILLATAAFLSAGASTPAERFFAFPLNAAKVGAAYCLILLVRSIALKQAWISPSGRKIEAAALAGNCLKREPLGWRIFPPIVLGAAAVTVRLLNLFGEETAVVFALLLGASALFSLAWLKRGGEPLAFIAACLPYLAFALSHALSPVMNPGDSLFYHYPPFEFIARSFASGRFLPPWLPQSGGIDIGFFHANLFFGLPHKAAGYFLYSLFPLSLPLVYKLQYLLGVIIFSLGWWLVLKKITGSRRAAYFGTLMITMGGTGITFHQEQVIATAYLLPWFALSLLKLKDSPVYLIAAGGLFGAGLTLHYPQIQLIAFAVTFLALSAGGRILFAAGLKSGKQFVLPTLALALLGIAPAFYLVHHAPRLSSGLREMDVGQRPSDLREYLQLQRGASSASPTYLRQYLIPMWDKTGDERPVIDIQDRCAFFVGRAGLLLAAAGLILAFPKSAAVGLAAVIFSLLSLGINSPVPLPRYLFELGVPFFDVFRQWVHFFPMINFSLSLLAAMAVAGLLSPAGKRFKRFAGLVIAVFVFLQVTDTAHYGHKYLSLFPVPAAADDLREQFAEPGEYSASAVFQYRDRYHLFRACGEPAIPENVFLAGRVLNLKPEDAFSPGHVCLALRRDGELSAVTRIPRKVLPIGVTVFSEETSRAKLRAGFNGLRGDIDLDRTGLLVTPMNIGLRPRALVNGEQKPVWPVNAALAGVLLDEGSHRLELRVGHDIYLVLFLLQWLLFGFLAVFFIKMNNPG